MDEIRQTFFQECEEQLPELEAGLLALEAGDGDGETVNAVFRAVHSVKGGAGAFNLTDLVRFAHVFENTLDALRTGKIQTDPPLLKVMLRAADFLSDLVRASRDGAPVDAARSDALAAELAACLPGAGAPAPAAAAPEPAFAFVPVTIDLSDFDDLMALPAAVSRHTVRFKPRPELYAKGNETALLFRELDRLGTVSVSCDAAELPLLDALDPEGAYLSWTAEVEGCADAALIREIFDFVEWDSDFSVDSDAPPPPEESEPEWTMADFGLATGGEVEAEPAPAAPPAPVPAAAAPAEPPRAPAPAAEAPEGERRSAPRRATIRVDLDRVDRLINLAGELVIHQAMLNERAGELGLSRRSAISNGLDDLEQLTRDIQDSVMAIRAQPVRSVFQRLPRLVREVASQTGKSVRLVVEGEETEVDTIVVEHLGDPLTHMIRNAIDHGIEKPETRLARGKPAEGCLRVAALHRSGRIVIEVSDDGGGINRPRVRQIAEDKGLIAKDAPLTDDEVDNLIFLPGFSTASTVSDISGRGVGMDVVRREIQSLSGRISISSRPGEGSTFTLSLPLTLAVLDGMVLSVAGQTVVVPLSAVVEILMPQDVKVHGFSDDARIIGLQDAFVPLVDAALWLGFRDRPVPPSDGVVLLLETDGGERLGLVVDAIQGQRQVVIKSLEAHYGKVPGVAAATILGDGRVALILDVEALVRAGGQHRHGTSALPAPQEAAVRDDPARDQRELVTFTIAEHGFCLDIGAVREIRGWTTPTPMPQTASHVRGTINLRGTVLSIVDIATMLGLPAQEATERHVIVVVEVGGRPIGLLVDAVTGIIAVEGRAVLPPPAAGPAVEPGLIAGVLSLDGRMLSLLDAAHFLPPAVDLAA